MSPRRHVAIGDPQAPFDTFLGILEHAGLLASRERLADDVHLVSMGDHFDWGKVPDRAKAADDGLRLLEWLARHDADQVTILAGNHDLARVSELAELDDATFARVQRDADSIYVDGVTDRAREPAFLRDHPFAPTSELIARDYSTFRVAQRALVTQLLRSRRFRLASEHDGLLLVHAGVTVGDLAGIGIVASSAAQVARELNRFLDERVRHWTSGRLELDPLHVPGTAALGDGRGVLYHRPSDPSRDKPEHFVGPPRRRFDPRELPAEFPQAIGHIRDTKCRELMPEWEDGQPARDGPLRSLSVDDDGVRYAHGCVQDARMYLLDNGMAHVEVTAYELFDLDRRQPLR